MPLDHVVVESTKPHPIHFGSHTLPRQAARYLNGDVGSKLKSLGQVMCDHANSPTPILELSENIPEHGRRRWV